MCIKIWIDAGEHPPLKPGWYVVKFEDNTEAQVPFVTTMSGQMKWLLPDEIKKPVLYKVFDDLNSEQGAQECDATELQSGNRTLGT